MTSTPKYSEKTVRYETVVDSLPEAWAYIMEKIEEVGPDPQVHIHPATEGPPPLIQALMGQQPEAKERKFHVAVEGSMKEVRTEVAPA